MGESLEVSAQPPDSPSFMIQLVAGHGTLRLFVQQRNLFDHPVDARDLRIIHPHELQNWGDNFLVAFQIVNTPLHIAVHFILGLVVKMTAKIVLAPQTFSDQTTAIPQVCQTIQ